MADITGTKYDVKAALKGNRTLDEISTFLTEHPELEAINIPSGYIPPKHKPRPPWLLKSAAIPAAGGTLGFLAGLIPGVLGGVPAIATAPAGAAIGTGGGEVIRRNLIDLLGYEDPNIATLNTANDFGTPELLGNVLKNPAIAAIAANPVRLALPGLIGSVPFAGPIAGKVGEYVQKSSGSLPASTYNAAAQKQFGTSTVPNPKLFERAASAAGRGDLQEVARKEIMNQGRGMAQPFSEIGNLRAGAYASAKPSGFFAGASPEQKVLANIGKGYSNILHEYLPQTIPFDKIYGASKAIYSPGTAFGVGGGGALLWLLKALLSGGQKNVTNFIGSGMTE